MRPKSYEALGTIPARFASTRCRQAQSRPLAAAAAASRRHRRRIRRCRRRRRRRRPSSPSTRVRSRRPHNITQNVVSGVNFGSYFTWNKDATVRRRRSAPPIWDATQNTWIYDPYAQVYAKEGVRFVSAASRSKTSGTWVGTTSARMPSLARGWPSRPTARGSRSPRTTAPATSTRTSHNWNPIGRIYVRVPPAARRRVGPGRADHRGQEQRRSLRRVDSD